jgi:hypothetical protein
MWLGQNCLSFKMYGPSTALEKYFKLDDIAMAKSFTYVRIHCQVTYISATQLEVLLFGMGGIAEGSMQYAATKTPGSHI